MTHYTPTIFFPNRIRHTARLLNVTTTYAVDLTLDEFLHLKILFPIEEIGIRRGDRLNRVAEKVVETFNDDFDAFGEINHDTRICADICQAFDAEKFGEIQIGGFTGGEDGGYTIADGNHRSIALAVLLQCGRMEYPTVTAVLAVSKDIAEEVIYHDEVSRER